MLWKVTAPLVLVDQPLCPLARPPHESRMLVSFSFSAFSYADVCIEVVMGYDCLWMAQQKPSPTKLMEEE